ncbi:MAG: hypothetical protein IJ125_03270, partial [Atopobiaceae bacterium]|nr:hypothetical protein [Atopobiaceae bacterium]
LSWLNASFYGAGDIFSNPLWPQDARIGAIWFLLALFWAKLIMSFATRMRSGWIVTLACFAAGVISMNYVWLPWSVQAGLCATPFMWIGMRLRELRFFEKRLPVVLWIGLIVVWVAAIYLKNPVAMAGSFFGEWPYLAPVKIAGSIAGTLCVVKLSQCIEHHISLLARLFDVLGQASLGILCVHLVSDNVIDWSRMGDYALFELGIMMPLILLVFSLVRTCCESAVGLIVHKLWSKLVR